MLLEEVKQGPFASAAAFASVLGQQLMALNQLSAQDVAMLAPLIFANQPNVPTGASAQSFLPRAAQPEQRLSQESGFQQIQDFYEGSSLQSEIESSDFSDCASDVSEVFEGTSRPTYEIEQPKMFDDMLGIGPEDINQFFSSLNAADMNKPPNLDVFTDLHEISGMLDLLESEVKVEPWEADPPAELFQLTNMVAPYQSPTHSEDSNPGLSPSHSTDDGFESDFDAASMSSGGSPIPDAVQDDSCIPMTDNSSSPQVVPEQPVTLPQPPRRRRRGPKKPAKYNGNGPIQLWQFLLELILNPQCTNLIQWTYDEKFEFKLLNPPLIATMWGKRKNKPNMNYEKLSRGLRYYYDKHIIDKVHGKRYVYQFVCDITKILGYNPTEPKTDGAVEDAVCGEPETVPESKFLSVDSPSSEDSGIQELDFSHFFN